MKTLLLQVRQTLVCTKVTNCPVYPSGCCDDEICESAKVIKVIDGPWVEGSLVREIPEQCPECSSPVDVNNLYSILCVSCGFNLLQLEAAS